MPAQTRKQAAQLWNEPPLPGMMDCITLQLNATYYKSGGQVRWVMVLRDPIGNDELMRMIGLTQPDTQEALEAMFHDLGQLIELVDYQLHGDVDDLKQALQEEPPPPAPLVKKPRARKTAG